MVSLRYEIARDFGWKPRMCSSGLCSHTLEKVTVLLSELTSRLVNSENFFSRVDLMDFRNLVPLTWMETIFLQIRRRKKANIMEEENHDEESQGEETEGDEIQDEENVDKNDVDGHDSASEDTVLEKEKELDKSESEEKHLESDPDTVQQSSQKKEVNKGNRSIANEEKENSGKKCSLL